MRMLRRPRWTAGGSSNPAAVRPAQLACRCSCMPLVGSRRSLAARHRPPPRTNPTFRTHSERRKWPPGDLSQPPRSHIHASTHSISSILPYGTGILPRLHLPLPRLVSRERRPWPWPPSRSRARQPAAAAPVTSPIASQAWSSPIQCRPPAPRPPSPPARLGIDLARLDPLQPAPANMASGSRSPRPSRQLLLPKRTGPPIGQAARSQRCVTIRRNSKIGAAAALQAPSIIELQPHSISTASAILHMPSLIQPIFRCTCSSCVI